MKRLASILALACCAGTAGAMDKPDVDQFFARMAVTAKPGQQRQWVAGDNIDGYFEGYSHSNERGAGYVMRKGTWLHNYVSYVGLHANDRARGAESVLPYGHHVRYPNGAQETLAVLSHHHAIALRIDSRRPASLALQPTLTAAATASARVLDERTGEREAVVAFASGFMALCGDQPFTVEEGLLLRAAAPARRFTVVAAFGATAEEALAEARALAQDDPVAAERRKVYADLTRSWLATGDAAYDKALYWSKAASRLFQVEEFGKGIWAGLPWFRDNWGRDTFIALPGTLLVTGKFEDAKAVLENFARFQNLAPEDINYGRIPNRVSADTAIIYNTVDGTPWMLREALEYIRYTGDKAFAERMYKLAIPYFDGAIAHYMDQDKLLTHDDADTWMDARIEGKQPWSARGPRAVEIQALWYTALQSGALLAEQAGDTERAAQWRAIAEQARASFLRLFWDGQTMADRLRADGSRDTKLRPNQLMLVSIPRTDFVPPEVQAKVTRDAVSGLLYPYGVASLSQDDPYFHPRHENPAYHHKDAAYHNGTVWGWNAGFTVTALDKFGYQDLAWNLSRNLGDQILNLGTIGNMSELLDALPPLHPSGTFAQSWSVAEFTRNAYQDYVGFRPDLLEGTLRFVPAIPAAWKRFDAQLPFGDGESLDVAYRHGSWQFTLHGKLKRNVEFDALNADKSRTRLRFELVPERRSTLSFTKGAASLDGQALEGTPALVSFAPVIGELHYVRPRAYRPEDFPVLRGKDVLKGIIERGEYR
ncbi:MAG TPA: amylo-alpha-1,6-glucosidase [Telluria sp.]|nr:amylo-alpha-1,6-glucosidase [Telluria sp.]